jgi:cupin fold WbuC family metalloprotein
MKTITADAMTQLLTRAMTVSRRRVNLNLHEELSDPINRFLNAGITGTYVQPHCHRAGKWELLNVLRGRLEVVTFFAEGAIKDRFTLDTEHTSLIEIPGGEWHTFIFHPPGAVVLEIKPGPYEPQFDKQFADWAPAEGDSASTAFLSWLERAERGEAWLERTHLR